VNDYGNNKHENNYEHTLDHTTYRIPVFIDRRSAAPEDSDEDADVFFGASRHRNVQFYVGNIDSRSTKTGITNFLNRNGVTITHMMLFGGENGLWSAKITVPYGHAHIMEDQDIWPHKIKCRKWIRAREWRQRFEMNDNPQNDGWTYKY